MEKAPYGKHIIVSDIEHPAIMNQLLGSNTGIRSGLRPVDARGFVKADALASLPSRYDLVSVMAVNNEIGSIQSIHDIAALLEDRPTISFHVDAVQALAKVATEVYLPERVDFATSLVTNSMDFAESALPTSKKAKDHPL